MLLLRPPTHKIAALGVYISGDDPAWDTERIDREIGEAQTAALERDPQADLVAIRDAHPAVAFAAGLTRYQPDAPAWDLQGRPTTASAYLRDGVHPTRFILRRIGWQDVEAARLVPGVRKLWGELIRRCLVEIQDPAGAFCWKLPEGAAGVPPDIMQALWDNAADLQASRGIDLWTELGVAAQRLSGPLMPHEGKPSGCGGTAPSPSPQPTPPG